MVLVTPDFRNILVVKHVHSEDVVQEKYSSRASFWEAAKIAMDSLSKSKLRSFLTLLGVILATSTLIIGLCR